MSPFSQIRAVRIRPTAAVGLLLIIGSVIGTTTLVRANNDGVAVLVAAEFIPAGTALTDDLLVDARIIGAPQSTSIDRTVAVGRVTAIDIGIGEIVSARSVDETGESTTTVAIPLGVVPADEIDVGSVISLWRVDDSGVAPPVTIAQRATLLAVSAGSFGSDSLVTVALEPTDVDRVLGAVGSSALIIATSSEIR